MDRRCCTLLLGLFVLGVTGTPLPGAAHENHVHETPADGFTEAEVASIRAWFRENPDPVLSGGHGLPAGLLATLIPGNELLAGIPRRRLPPALLGVLPTPHPGYERLLVGDRVLLVDAGSRRIIDLIIDPGR